MEDGKYFYLDNKLKNNMKVSIIVAKSLNNVIGSGNGIPWKLKDDMKFFKKTTMGHTVIMGRKTFESIGKSLPGRVNIIVTRNKEFTHDECVIAHSLEEAISVADYPGVEHAFIIGGGEIYDEALRKGVVDEIHITQVNCEVEGDVYFSREQADVTEWRITGEIRRFKTDIDNEFDFIIYKLVKQEVK